MITKTKTMTAPTLAAVGPVDVADERDVLAGHCLAVGAGHVERGDGEPGADDQLAEQLALGAEPVGVALAHLEEVVQEADRAAEHEQPEQHQRGHGGPDLGDLSGRQRGQGRVPVAAGPEPVELLEPPLDRGHVVHAFPHRPDPNLFA